MESIGKKKNKEETDGQKKKKNKEETDCKKKKKLQEEEDEEEDEERFHGFGGMMAVIA